MKRRSSADPVPEEYEPGITTHQMRSKGLRGRLHGRKTGRVHHLLSGLERSVFTLLDHSPAVINIEEQYRLDLESTSASKGTLQIAKEFGFRHPYDVERKVYRPFHTDFVITVRTKRGGEKRFARYVKYSAETVDDGTPEALKTARFALIEREYWMSRGVDWSVYTEEGFPEVVNQNERFLGSTEP